ncbi:MAG TPA: hypothetical protein VFY79_11855 [Dehalococcoidia bacterium]|nr:hypothetical protein [Dehalococcoidia bacterium]
MATQTPAPARQPHPDSAIHFPLQDNERVLQVCRRHWIYLWPRIALFAAFAIVPVIVAGVLLGKAGHFDGLAARIFWIAALVYLVYWGGRSLLAWYRYHNDIWVITNQRIIDSTKSTPFNLKLSTADLVNVQDMTVERNGILRTMLDYGDIVCQTAADVQEFRLPGIPDPRDVQLLVDRERDRERMRGQQPAGAAE